MKHFAILLFACFWNMLQAQEWKPGHYFKQSIANTLAKTQAVATATNYGYLDGVCILGAYIREGSRVSWTLSMERGTSYLLIAGGDDDATDIDLALYDAAGREVASDRQTDNTPYLLFTAPLSGSYTVKMKLYSCRSTGSFSTLVLMKEGANVVPVRNLAIATAKIMAVGERLNEKGVSVKFHDMEDEWFLFGTILNNRGESSITGIQLGDADHLLVAAGDGNLNDADLALYQSAQASIPLEKDETPDALPVLQHYSSSAYNYKLKISNASSDGKTLIMAAILTK